MAALCCLLNAFHFGPFCYDLPMFLNDDKNSEIRVQRQGGLIHVILNRPAALNALTLEMVRLLSTGLRQWAADETVRAVLFSGEGGRAFCAGGDIKSAYHAGMAYRRGEIDKRVMALFFGEEYGLNRLLFHYNKPLIALMNGITMGGGFGIAGPCRYRIALPTTRFAMPETGIGFFPDVGASWYLNRAPGLTGRYLGLTGLTVGPADMIYGGFASHFSAAPAADIVAALATALDGKTDADAAIDDVLAGFQAEVSEEDMLLAPNRAVIDQTFAAPRIEDILAALLGQGTDWAAHTARVIESRSPTSLKVTLARLREAADQDFDAITALDFTIAQHFLMGHDFYEGVRAMVVSKDRMPQWAPQTFEALTEDIVHGYFAATGYRLADLAA